MTQKLPPFRPVMLHELRTIWSQHHDPEVRRLVLEVVRYRDVLTDIDRLYKTIHQAWRESVGGNLVALHLLQTILYTERGRLPDSLDPKSRLAPVIDADSAHQ